MRVFFDGLLDGDEDTRPKMGRVSMAEEQLMKRLMSSDRLFNFIRYSGARRNPLVPALKTSRPTSAQGGQSFVFSMKGWHSPGRNERFCVGQGATAKADGLTYHAKKRHMGGIGAYRFTGLRPPAGMREVSTFRSAQLRVGGAGAFQEYIERDGSIECAQGIESSFGNIHQEQAFRQMFWEAVERREGSAKRVQTRIIAELPFEKEIGPEGRQQILKELGAMFDGFGLPWHAVVHVPEQQSDPRNFHLHLLFHDRPLLGWDSWDQPIFADRKNAQVRARDFIKDLRCSYAQIVNRAFQAAGLKRQWDPRTYKEMGIDKPPQRHLGSAVMGLERRGVVTANGKRAAEAEEAWRYRTLSQERTIKLVGMANRLEARIEHIKESQTVPTSNSVKMAMAEYLEAMTKASRQYLRVANLHHQKLWLRERNRMLRSRLELLLEDPEFGGSSKKFVRKIDRFYARMGRNVGELLEHAEERMRNIRQAVTQAHEGFAIELLVDRLRRADGAIEQAVGQEKLDKSQQKDNDSRYDRLLAEQQKHLRARAQIQAKLPEGTVWRDIEEKVAGGSHAWNLTFPDFSKAQEVVAGLKTTTRALERFLKRELRHEEGLTKNEQPVSAISQARAEKAAVLRDIRKSGFLRDVRERAGHLVGQKPRAARKL
tara:strand:- start:1583 stop:3547 length:1965 start_codon:yes stop_codon:yes gene_type:complete